MTELENLNNLRRVRLPRDQVGIDKIKIKNLLTWVALTVLFELVLLLYVGFSIDSFTDLFVTFMGVCLPVVLFPNSELAQLSSDEYREYLKLANENKVLRQYHLKLNRKPVVKELRAFLVHAEKGRIKRIEKSLLSGDQ